MTSPKARRLLLKAGAVVICATCLVVTAPGKDRPAPSLVGSWRLVRYVDTPDSGEPIEAFGKQPIGLFLFTADGHVSISLMRNPPDFKTPTTDPDPDTCIPSWYCAYFGTYTVSYEKGVWITHVLGSNIPTYLGTDQPRTFKLDGDTLSISEAYTANGKVYRAERVLKREIAASPVQ